MHHGYRHHIMDTCMMYTCIMYTCIMNTCTMDTCIMVTYIMDTCIMDTCIMDTSAWVTRPERPTGAKDEVKEARVRRPWARRACALKALGLLLADGALTVGRGKTF